MGRLERVVVREGNGNVMVTNIIPGDRYFIGYLMENNGNGTLTKNVILAPVALPIPFRFAGRTCPWRGWRMEVGHHPAFYLVQGHNFSIRLLLCDVLLSPFFDHPH